ncbi:MAG: DUF3604 domain-containing protein, partial [Pseudomonadota bacterium]
GNIRFDTPLVKFDLPVSEIGAEDLLFDQSDRLPRFVKVYRLPEILEHRSMRFTTRIDIKDQGDNPIFIRLTQEDGTRAWTSPIYVYR